MILDPLLFFLSAPKGKTSLHSYNLVINATPFILRLKESQIRVGRVSMVGLVGSVGYVEMASRFG